MRVAGSHFAAFAAGVLGCAMILACSRAPEQRIPEPAATPAPADSSVTPGTRSLPPDAPGSAVRIAVGRCGASGAELADRSGVLGPQEAVCVAVTGSGLASAGAPRLQLSGATEPAILEERSLVVTADRPSFARFDPVGSWPLGTYRVVLLSGAQELAFWELEIRADGASIPAVAE